ncbi:MAG: hypothetical protein QMC34_05725, partial [Flavobacteriales bacterium]
TRALERESDELFSYTPPSTTLYFTNSGGSYASEKWIEITTGPNGTGTILYAQGSGVYGNGSGLLTDEPFTVTDGTPYYISCYDKYADGWDGTTYEIRTAVSGGGILVANNGGLSPNDGVDGDGSSAWQTRALERESDELFSYTPPSCNPPSTLTATNITTTSADLGWTSAGNLWDIELGAIGFTQGAGTMVTAATANPHALSGLSVNTSYDFYVRNDCGASGISTWAGPFSFTTAFFNAAIPSCTDFEANSLGTSTTLTTNAESSASISATAAANSSAYGIMLTGAGFSGWSGGSTSSTETQAWVTNTSHQSSINMIVDATAETAVLLKFDLRQEYGYGNKYSWFRVTVNGLQVGASINPTTSTSDVFANQSYDLSAYAGTTFTLKLEASCKYVADKVLIDNICLSAPSCSAPSALAATNITATSADLGWTTGALWDIEMGAAGFTPTGTPTTVGTTTNPYNATSLTANTSYDFYVRNDCGASGISTWAGPFSFTTICAVFTAPFAESFDATTLPSCWSQSATTGGPWVFGNTGIFWNTSGCPAPTDHTSNGGNMASLDHSSTDVGVILEMPVIDVSSLTIPNLDFWYYMCNTGYSPINELYIEAWDGSAWTLVSSNTIGTSGWEKLSYNISTFTYGANLVKVRFRSESGGSSGDYYGDAGIDDVSVTCSTSSTDTQVECDTYTWLDGVTYTASNTTATFTTTNAAGCSNVATLNLTINNAATSTDTQVACDTYTWLDGNTYNTSNNTATYNIVGGAANGCDSLVTLNLTINNATTSTDTQVACDTYTWLDGVTYTASNTTATFTSMNTAGCTNVATLNLTINSSTTSTDTQVACDTYTWLDGNTYNTSNNTATYNIVGGAANGCDSLVTLNLTINNATTSTDTQVACDTYTWHGAIYTASNTTATFTTPNAAGCDSIVTLDLTILNSTTFTVNRTVCDLLVSPTGKVWNTTGVFNDTLTNSVGCDSVITFNLTVVYSYSRTDNIALCPGQSYRVGPSLYTTAGTYTNVFSTIPGCDSTIITNLS